MINNPGLTLKESLQGASAKWKDMTDAAKDSFAQKSAPAKKSAKKSASDLLHPGIFGNIEDGEYTSQSYHMFSEAGDMMVADVVNEANEKGRDFKYVLKKLKKTVYPGHPHEEVFDTQVMDYVRDFALDSRSSDTVFR